MTSTFRASGQADARQIRPVLGAVVASCAGTADSPRGARGLRPDRGHPNFRVCGPKYGADAPDTRLLGTVEFQRQGERLKVGSWTLEAGEFDVRTRGRSGFAVVLDTTITPELAREGAARDLIHRRPTFFIPHLT
ncbi:MAG: hypothetical protein ACRD0K_12475 [Egibacteraceae bacterium]